MNKIVASISLGTAVCITASAFAQDSHLSLTRQSVASMHEIAAALDKVTDEPGAAAAVETVKKVHKKLLDIGKRQLELPGATLQEQAQVSAQMTEAQKISGELIKSLSRLKKEGLLTPDLQKPWRIYSLFRRSWRRLPGIRLSRRSRSRRMRRATHMKPC